MFPQKASCPEEVPKRAMEKCRNEINKKTKKKKDKVMGKPQPVFEKSFRLPSIVTND